MSSISVLPVAGRSRRDVDRTVADTAALHNGASACTAHAPIPATAATARVSAVTAGHHADMPRRRLVQHARRECCAASGSALSGGTMRSRAGTATNAGSASVSGSTGSAGDAPFAACRACCRRTSRSGTPAPPGRPAARRRSASPPAPRTAARAALVWVQAARRPRYLCATPNGSSSANSVCSASIGSGAESPSHRLQQRQQRAPSAARALGSPAWKSHGVASNARPRTRSGRRCAAASAAVAAHAVAGQHHRRASRAPRSARSSRPAM